MKIAVIGTGISGLTFANRVTSLADITLFEKSRGVGGRMSTRYNDMYQFDHGAPYFSVRSKEFKQFIQSEIVHKTIEEWKINIVTLEPESDNIKKQCFESHYVATPKMTSICKTLADGHNIHLNCCVTSIFRHGSSWFLIDSRSEQYGPFDWVVCSAPSAQTSTLFPSEFSGHEVIARTVMSSCFAFMIGLPNSWQCNWEVATVKNSPIDMIFIDSTKPNRNCKGRTSIVAISKKPLPKENENLPEEMLKKYFCNAVLSLLDLESESIDYTQLHFWRYASVVREDVVGRLGFLIDPAIQLAAIGDWCLDGTVEGAFLSGFHLGTHFEKMYLIDK